MIGLFNSVLIYFNILSLPIIQKNLTDINEKGLYLTRVAQSGNLEQFKILLGNPDYDPTWENSHVFQMACESGHLHIVNELMLDNRIDPATELNSPLYWSAGKGHFNIVARLLLSDKVKNTPIFADPSWWAFQKGNYEMSIIIGSVIKSYGMKIGKDKEKKET